MKCQTQEFYGQITVISTLVLRFLIRSFSIGPIHFRVPSVLPILKHPEPAKSCSNYYLQHEQFILFLVQKFTYIHLMIFRTQFQRRFQYLRRKQKLSTNQLFAQTAVEFKENS